MRFHVLGLSNAKTNKEYGANPFAQKVRLICKILMSQGHTVYHYGVEGSDPMCTENITVLSQEVFHRVHEAYDWKKTDFLIDDECEATKVFEKNAVIEIYKRKEKGDFLLCGFGHQQKPIADAVNLITVELGIGHTNSFAPYRIFESYAWMHYTYGVENKPLSPSFYDAVIPAYYDLDDYIFNEKKDDYFFFIARPTPLKGLEIAVKVSDILGVKLIVAGQGTPHMTGNNMEFIGVINIQERAKYMSRAKATFIPTYYIEPFGSTQVESLLGGTPIITTDFGAMPEINIHGVTGYRCRSLEQFVWAAKNINNIDPKLCRYIAETNYSLERVGKMYEEYFNMVSVLFYDKKGWYAENNKRTELDWLNKKYNFDYFYKNNNL